MQSQLFSPILHRQFNLLSIFALIRYFKGFKNNTLSNTQYKTVSMLYESNQYLWKMLIYSYWKSQNCEKKILYSYKNTTFPSTKRNWILGAIFDLPPNMYRQFSRNSSEFGLFSCGGQSKLANMIIVFSIFLECENCWNPYLFVELYFLAIVPYFMLWSVLTIKG